MKKEDGQVEKVSKTKLTTRIMCGFLALLMIAGAIILMIQLLSY